MDSSTACSAKAPQSRGVSGSLRRLAARSRAARVLAAGALLTLSAAHARAQTTYQYQGGGTAGTPTSGVFSTGFTPTIVSGGTTTSQTTSADTLSFGGAAGGASYTATDDLTSTINANALSFSNAAGILVTLATGTNTGASNSITLGGTTPTVTSGAGAVVNGLNLILAANTGFNIGAGGFTQNGVVSGTGSLTMNGPGTLTVAANNTYTGGTIVNGGTLQDNFGGQSYGALRGTATVNTGGTLALNAGDALGYNAISAGNSLAQLNIFGGTVDIMVNANEGFTTNLTMTGGTFSSTGGGAFNIDPGQANAPAITTNASATTALISAPVVQRSGTTSLSINVASGGAGTTSGSDLTISGVISGGGGGITKNGAGILTLTGANTYGGATAIGAGTLTLGGGGTLGGGSYAGAITDNGAFVDSSTANQTISNVISGTGSLTQNGTGTLTLLNVNTFTGGTTVNGGTLVLNDGPGNNNGSGVGGGNGNGAVRGVVTVNSGGTLLLGATNALGFNAGSQVSQINIIGGTVTTAGAVTGNEGYITSFNLTGGTLAYAGASSSNNSYQFNAADATAPGITSNASAATSTVSGGVDIRGGSLVYNVASGTTASGIDLLDSGVIYSSGTYGITKTGAGALDLTGANTYTGATTVGQGTIVAANNSALGTGALVFNPGSGSTATVTFTSAAPTVGSLASSGAGTSRVVLGNKAASTPTVITFGSSNTSTAYAGTISDAGTAATGGLAKTGTGTQAFTGAAANTYSGGTAVNQGVLTGNAGSYGTGAVTVASGATVDYTQSATQSAATPTATNSISGAGTASFGGDAMAGNGSGGTVNYTGQDTAAQTSVVSGTVSLNRTGGAALSGPVAVATGATVGLGSSNQIATATQGNTSPANVALNGGRLNANGYSDGSISDSSNPTAAAVTSHMGTLSLGNGTTSTLDFGAGQTGSDVFAFADSVTSLQNSTGRLNVIDYSGGLDALYIGSSADLTSSELSLIAINGFGVSQLPNGEITAVTPEPSGVVSLLLGAGALGGLIAVRRRRAAQAA